MPNPEPTHALPPPPTPPSQSRWLVLSILVTALIAGLIAALAWQQHQIAGHQAAWQTQVQTAQHLSTQINQTHSHAMERLAHTEARLEALTHQANRSNEHNALLNAWQMLHLADYQRQYHHNARAAAQLVRLAEEQINTAQYPGLGHVARILERDRAALAEAAEAQNPSSWLKDLENIKDAIGALEQFPTAQPDSAKHTNPQQSQPTTTDQPQPSQALNAHAWRQTLAHVWAQIRHALSQMVLIQRRTTPVTPLLSNQNLVITQNNLLLYLSQAQWAILNQQPALYTDSITRAQALLNTYFDNHAAQHQALITQMHALQNIPINQPLPSISSSLNIIEKYLNEPKIQEKYTKIHKKKIIHEKEKGRAGANQPASKAKASTAETNHTPSGAAT